MADPCCGACCLAVHCRLAAWCCADCCQSTSFSCCSSFHPTWCASLLLVIRFTCPRSTTGLPAGSACGIDLVARPYRWPILGVGLAAYPVAWLLGAAPVVAWFHLLWHASLALVLWFTCPRSATGLLASSVCGAVLAARPLRWQILGVEFDVCPTAWLLVFERFGSLARPPSWLFTWIPSVPKAGMSSVNNSPAETARQSRREK
ncbi:hypothetical protein V6N11_004970 [Hibiscus sabdariffa]|uniref:Uncharacterized protein n=1 Tax=Hibiscus sabdariffa TaxID=183260 RepID=A0ABR2AG31_9ROSI